MLILLYKKNESRGRTFRRSCLSSFTDKLEELGPMRDHFGIVLDPEDEYNAILLIPTYHIKPLNRMDYVSIQKLIIS